MPDNRAGRMPRYFSWINSSLSDSSVRHIPIHSEPVLCRHSGKRFREAIGNGLAMIAL